MKKVLSAIGGHFSKPVQPMIDLLGKIPFIIKTIFTSTTGEFERVLKAATGPKK